MNIKKVSLWSFIVTLVLIAFVAIGIFLFGSLDQTSGKILLTLTIIAFYSLNILIYATLVEKKKLVIMAYIAIAMSISGALFDLGFVWELIYNDFDWVAFKIISSFVVIPFTFSLTSLVFFVTPVNIKVKVVQYFTVVLTFITGVIFLYLIWQDNSFGNSDLLFRILGVSLTLNVLGVILTPILNKVMTMPKNEDLS